MRRSFVLASLAAVLLLSSCQLGPRPTLEPTAPISDPNVAELVGDLNTARTATFTASYTITSTLTGSETVATVANDGGSYRVTIGDVGYVTNGTETQTCTSTGCETGLNDAYVSDLNVTHRFWGTSFESRLRLDAERNIGNPAATKQDVAAHPARCVTIPLPGGAVEYCTIPDGPLAKYSGPDAQIELVSYTTTVDTSTFGN